MNTTVERFHKKSKLLEYLKLFEWLKNSTFFQERVGGAIPVWLTKLEEELNNIEWSVRNRMLDSFLTVGEK
jgi:hypothetical protein